MEKKWHALFSRQGKIKKLTQILSKRKIEHFIFPQRNKEQGIIVQPNRKKQVEDSLLEGLVFVKTSPAEAELIKTSIDYGDFMYWLGQPAEINEKEIENLQYFCNLYNNIAIDNIPVNPHQSSSIIKETFLHHSKVDLDGSLIPIQGVRVRCTLPSLGKMLIANTDRAFFENLDVYKRKEALM